MELHERLADFYRQHLPAGTIDGTILKGPCPFCASRSSDENGSLMVYLGARSYFAGYFRCQNRCVPGGFAPHFARLSGIDPATVPGYDPDREPFVQVLKFPAANINQDVKKYRSIFCQDRCRPRHSVRAANRLQWPLYRVSLLHAERELLCRALHYAGQ